MKLSQIALAVGTVLLAGVIGYAAGYLVEFWHSPLAAPLCIDTGRDYLALALSRDYVWLWLLIALVGYVAIGVPLWMMALRKRSKQNG